MIRFTVYGAPVAQPRQRQRVIRTKGGKMFAHNYTPTDSPVNSWKADVKLAAQGVMPEQPWTGPVRITINFFLPRPNSLCRGKDPDGAIWHQGSKDIDNLYKSVTDALSGIIYLDDRQICDARIAKFYHEIHGRPRAEIEMEILR